MERFQSTGRAYRLRKITGGGREEAYEVDRICMKHSECAERLEASL